MNEEEKSRSQAKREAKQATDLAIRLTGLSVKQRAKLPLPPIVQDSINSVIKTTSHIAKKRCVSHLGHVLRSLPEGECDVIEQAYQGLMVSMDTQSPQFQLTEQWRERLMDEGGVALTELLKAYRCDDIQRLKVLVRQAQQERQGDKNQQKYAGASKALFRFLRDMMI